VQAFLHGLAYGAPVAGGVAVAGFVMVAVALPGRPRADAIAQAEEPAEPPTLEAAP
jgi:hypothetical protein